MRKILPLLLCLFTMWLLPACSDDATKPPASAGGDGTIHGQIHDSDFEFEVTDGQPGDPFAGPFLLRGRNLHYSDDLGALVVDLTVVNRGIVSQHEPIGLTFIKLDPDGVTVLNPDNNINDDGAAIVFHFANDDGLWTPAEESLPRTVEFGVSKGTAIAFVARIDLGATPGGVIAGRVWNDENKDGVMDASEGGLGDVGVYLHPFTNGIVDPRLIRTVRTDPDGRYQFDGLDAGGYEVSIAPSTVNLFPTTPTGIHVLLTEDNGQVSSYKNANFGAVRQNLPPPPQGEHLHASGKFAPPDGFASATVDHFTCPDSIPQPLVTDPPVNEDCIGGRLRGSVTEIAPERHAFRVMATWVLALNGLPTDLKVGSRVDVHVNPGPGPLTWVADSIAPWTGDHDEITGHVDAVEPASDGTIRFRVLDTWVTAAEVSVGPR
ncbi:MAG TPA: SdrD B-like domain-containing protein [Candidatus Krumholzibacteria bacterium]|nr:SdrD B-like domain-containing protein [Candidatus Krumholzibacteria bacterium]